MFCLNGHVSPVGKGALFCSSFLTPLHQILVAHLFFGVGGWEEFEFEFEFGVSRYLVFGSRDG